MKNLILFCLFCIVLTSCTTTTKSLYSWGNYQERAYDYVKTGTDKSLDELLEAYVVIINNQKGERNTIPPGICADYGYLLYNQGKKEEGLTLLNKETSLYPESSVLVSQIIKKIENENN